MAVLIQFTTLIVQKSRIQSVPGLREHLSAKYPNAWEDEYLWAMGSMTPPNALGEELQAAGLTLRDTSSGVTKWRDICVVDYNKGPTNPCDWIHVDPVTRSVWLVGTAQGEIAKPAHVHEANPAFVPSAAVQAMPSGHAPSQPAPSQPAPSQPAPSQPAPSQPLVQAPAPPALSSDQGNAAAEALLQNLFAGALQSGGSTLPGNANFNADDERKWRFWRIGALAFILLRGVVYRPWEGFGFYPEHLFALLYPGLFQMALLGFLGWQIYALSKPAHEKPRTAVYLVDHSQGKELFRIIGGVLLSIVVIPFFATSVFMNVAPDLDPTTGESFGFAWANLLFQGAHIVAFLVIVLRETVIIDGEKQKVIRLSWIPKTLEFAKVQGLGQFTHKVNGVVQSVHLSLFYGAHFPWKLDRCAPNKISEAASALIQRTGVPHRGKG